MLTTARTSMGETKSMAATDKKDHLGVNQCDNKDNETSSDNRKLSALEERNIKPCNVFMQPQTVKSPSMQHRVVSTIEVIDLTQIDDTNQRPQSSLRQLLGKQCNCNFDDDIPNTKKTCRHSFGDQNLSSPSLDNDDEVAVIEYVDLISDPSHTFSDQLQDGDSDSDDDTFHLEFRMLVAQIMEIRSSMERFCTKLLSITTTLARGNDNSNNANNSNNLCLKKMIERLENRNLISPSFALCMHDMRRLGNEAAHETSSLFEMYERREHGRNRIYSTIATYRSLKKEFRRNQRNPQHSHVGYFVVQAEEMK